MHRLPDSSSSTASRWLRTFHTRVSQLVTPKSMTAAINSAFALLDRNLSFLFKLVVSVSLSSTRLLVNRLILSFTSAQSLVSTSFVSFPNTESALLDFRYEVRNFCCRGSELRFKLGCSLGELALFRITRRPVN